MGRPFRGQGQPGPVREMQGQLCPSGRVGRGGLDRGNSYYQVRSREALEEKEVAGVLPDWTQASAGVLTHTEGL